MKSIGRILPPADFLPLTSSVLLVAVDIGPVLTPSSLFVALEVRMGQICNLPGSRWS